MCVYLDLYLDPCVLSGLEPRVWARACADARADARACVASAVGCDHRSECIGVSITRMRACVRACAVTFLWLYPSEPMSVHCAAARARGARQGHRLHEGDGAPGVARPVQALGDPVRPAPPAAAVLALQRVRCRALGRATRR